MTVFDFMSDSPFVTVILAILIAFIAEYVLFKLPSRYFRSRNIAKHGWPPSHCDADGDFRPSDLKEES